MSSAVRAPPLGVTSGSSVAVDDEGRARRGRRSPSARRARGDDRRAAGGPCRPGGSSGRRRRRAPGRRALLVEVVGAADRPAAASSACLDRLVAVGGRAGAAASASPRASGWPTSGSPVVDMIEVSVRTRSGCSMAMVWAIIPPIDAPTTWADSMPRASSRPTASAAMSVRRYGTSTGSPCGGGQERREEVAAGVVELRGAADVAVVVPDHEEPAVDERVAQLHRPGDHLRAEAHHQEQRLAARVPEGLVAELDPVGLDHRSPGIGSSWRPLTGRSIPGEA